MAQNGGISTKVGVWVCVAAAILAGGVLSTGRAAQGQGNAGATVDVLFSPNGGCTARIVEEIEDAELRVLVQCFYFTSQPIADAIVEAQKRGLECVVIADKSQEKMTYARLPVLRRAGVTVLIDGKHATANNKIILIDRRTILTGSLNFTKAAEEKNAENLLVIEGHRRLFARYLDNFNHHKSHARKYRSG